MAGEKKKKKEEKQKLGSKRMFLLAAFTAFISLGTALLVLAFMFENEQAEPTPLDSHLIEFYGRECPHCGNMAPVVSQVETELGVRFSKLEVWHNKANMGVFESYSEAIKEACMGDLAVPSFYNNRTGKALCGEVDKETLIAWARGE